MFNFKILQKFYYFQVLFIINYILLKFNIIFDYNILFNFIFKSNLFLFFLNFIRFLFNNFFKPAQDHQVNFNLIE